MTEYSRHCPGTPFSAISPRSSKPMPDPATALYARADDVLKAAPERAPWRPLVGIEPQICDAELVTLAVLQALLGFTSEARWLRHARAHLRHLFPYLPGQPRYSSPCRGPAVLHTPDVNALTWANGRGKPSLGTH